MSGHSILPPEYSSVHVDTHRQVVTRHHVQRPIDWSIVAGAALCGALTVIMAVALWWPSSPAEPEFGPPAGAIARGLAAERRRTSPAQESQVSRRREETRRPADSTVSGDFEFAFRGAANPDAWGGDLPLEENPYESETPLEARGKIDQLVFAQWSELNIQPARLCTDGVFLRRVYLDTLGTLPTLDEAQQFIADPDPAKRTAWIDRVLERPEFADYSAMKWSDILRVKAEFPIKLWPNAAQAYHRWLRTALANNMPYDRFARELLTASGSNFRTPQVNFYRAVQSKEPKAIAEAVALTFLCERTDKWPDYRLEGMSAFFSQVGYKPTGEWKEEIVFFDPRQGESGAGNEPLLAVFPNGEAAQIPAGDDPRRVFADWLVHKDNPWFARAMANRVWYWLLGRGIVDPPDDVRPDNPASNRELLDHLAKELVSSKYDLKHLYRQILNSQTYQLACIPRSQDSRAGEVFAYYHVRRLEAEVLIDAVCQLTGTTETYSSIIPEPFTFLPDQQRAIGLPDGSITSSFLEMFGRPPRDTGLDAERNNRFSAAQALHLLNSNHLRKKLKEGAKSQALLQQVAASPDPSEMIYLAILSRRPMDSERYIVDGLCHTISGAQDVMWALMNSDEFLFRH